MAELVAVMNQQPWIAIENFEVYWRQKADVFHAHQLWSIEAITKTQRPP